MIPFQLGFRNLIGILLPGAVLTLVLFTCLDILFPGRGQLIAQETGNGTGTLVVAFLLTAYILGSVIRLWSADTVDHLSASLVKDRLDPIRENTGTDGKDNIEVRRHEGHTNYIERHLKELLRAVVEGEPKDRKDDEDYLGGLLQAAWPKANQTEEATESMNDSLEYQAGQEAGLIDWAWKYDEFPYPVWELMKLRLYHPDGVFRFFEPYIRCFATGYRRNKEFFNYCKAVIYEAHQGRRHALAEEVQGAEAQVRFFAGVFWALLLSAVALVLTTLLLIGRSTTSELFRLSACAPLVLALLFAAAAAWVVWQTRHFVRQTTKAVRFWKLSGIAVGVLLAWSVVSALLPRLKPASFMNFVALAMVAIAFVIVADGRFRGLRLKEVDTVFDAFYLVERSSTRAVNPPE